MMVRVREDRSVRSRACYLALGVTLDGDREVLGMWWQETEGSKFWLAVLNDLHQAKLCANSSTASGVVAIRPAARTTPPQRSRPR